MLWGEGYRDKEGKASPRRTVECPIWQILPAHHHLPHLTDEETTVPRREMICFGVVGKLRLEPRFLDSKTRGYCVMVERKYPHYKSQNNFLKKGKATRGREPWFFIPAKAGTSCPTVTETRGAHTGSQNSQATGVEGKVAGHSYEASRPSCCHHPACKEWSWPYHAPSPVSPRFSVIAVLIYYVHEESNGKTYKPISYISPVSSPCLSAWFAPFLKAWTTILAGVIRSVQTTRYLNGNLSHTSRFYEGNGQVADDSGRASLRHSLILFSMRLHQCLCLPRQGPHLPDPQHQWRPTQWGLANTAVGMLRTRSLNALMVQSQNSLSFHWPLWNERELCERACRASSVWGPSPVSKFPTVTLETLQGVGRPCEGPLFVPGDSLDGGCGQLGSGPGKEGGKRTGKRDQNAGTQTKGPGQD